MIDVKSLLNYDIKKLKELDLTQLKERLFQRQDVLVNLAVIILSVIIAFNIYNHQVRSAQTLTSDIVSLEDKLASLEKFENSQKALAQYVNSLPQGISADAIIEIVSGLAAFHNLQISSFSPANKENRTLYETTSLKVNVTAKNYNDILKFIDEIEHHKATLKVRNFTGRMEKTSAYQRQQGRIPDESQPDSYISAEIEINSVGFKK